MINDLKESDLGRTREKKTLEDSEMLWPEIEATLKINSKKQYHNLSRDDRLYERFTNHQFCSSLAATSAWQPHLVSASSFFTVPLVRRPFG